MIVFIIDKEKIDNALLIFLLINNEFAQNNKIWNFNKTYMI